MFRVMWPLGSGRSYRILWLSVVVGLSFIREFFLFIFFFFHLLRASEYQVKRITNDAFFAQMYFFPVFNTVFFSPLY